MSRKTIKKLANVGALFTTFGAVALISSFLLQYIATHDNTQADLTVGLLAVLGTGVIVMGSIFLLLMISSYHLSHHLDRAEEKHQVQMEHFHAL